MSLFPLGECECTHDVPINQIALGGCLFNSILPLIGSRYGDDLDNATVALLAGQQLRSGAVPAVLRIGPDEVYEINPCEGMMTLTVTGHGHEPGQSLLMMFRDRQESLPPVATEVTYRKTENRSGRPTMVKTFHWDCNRPELLEISMLTTRQDRAGAWYRWNPELHCFGLTAKTNQQLTSAGDCRRELARLPIEFNPARFFANELN